MRCLLLYSIVSMLLASCTLDSSGTPGDSELVPSGSRWINRKISSGGADSTLVLANLKALPDSELEVILERLSAPGGGSSYDFSSRFYFLVSLEEEASLLKGTVTAVKKGLHDSYTYQSDSLYSDLISELGFSSLDAELKPENSSLLLTLSSGEDLTFYRDYIYDEVYEGVREIDGSDQNGQYHETVFYNTMDDSFRFYYIWSFSYTNDEGSRVSISGSYDTYGSRSASGDGRVCRIESFSNRAYPRRFYDEAHYKTMYDQQISKLGFDSFTEERSGDNLVLKISIGSDLYTFLLKASSAE